MMSPLRVPISQKLRPATSGARKSAVISGDRIGYVSTAENPGCDRHADAGGA